MPPKRGVIRNQTSAPVIQWTAPHPRTAQSTHTLGGVNIGVGGDQAAPRPQFEDTHGVRTVSQGASRGKGPAMPPKDPRSPAARARRKLLGKPSAR